MNPTKSPSQVAEGATTEGLPVTPRLSASIGQVPIPARPSPMDARALRIAGLPVLLGMTAGLLAGQLFPSTTMERKILLAAGAAGGMAAIFGSPVSAVLLAIELLLFEFSPRSLIPVALSASAAAAVRYALVGSQPVFLLPPVL